jgi:hypothetical protein
VVPLTQNGFNGRDRDGKQEGGGEGVFDRDGMAARGRMGPEGSSSTTLPPMQPGRGFTDYKKRFFEAVKKRDFEEVGERP